MNLDGNQNMAISYGDATNNTSPNNRRTKYGSTPLVIEQWYFVIGICRGPMDMGIYIDCINENGYYEGFGGDLGYTDCQGSIGRLDGGVNSSPYYFKGSVDEFRYWNKALAPADIDSLCLLVKIKETHRDIDEGVTLFPNPANNFINIQNLPVSVVRIEMFNSIGELICSQPSNESVSIGNLSSGIYFLMFLNDQNNIIDRKKFIKQ